MEMRNEMTLDRSKERGTVVFLHGAKNFGFIKSNDDDREVFFHAKGLLHASFDDLREGSSVEYCVATIRGRLKAIAIEVIAQ